MDKRGSAYEGLSGRMQSLPREEESGKKVTVGSIAFNTDICIKESEYATLFRGKYGHRNVTVKRMPRRDTEVNREQEVHRKLEDHANILRFHHMEKTDDFYYIAFELDLGSLEDYVKKSWRCILQTDDISLTKQTMEGLKWLHSQQILHLNMKPSNILLVAVESSKLVAKISDLGQSEELYDCREATDFTGDGSPCWMAPELTSDRPEATRACDVFALGCVIFYVLTHGEHPFGDEADRGYNTKRHKYNLSALEDVTSKSLVEDMIQHKPGKRPSAADVLGHPFFWIDHTKTRFLQKASAHLMNSRTASLSLSETLVENTHLVFGGTKLHPFSWKKKFGEAIDAGFDISLKREKDMLRQKETLKKVYDDSVAGLLQLIRTKVHRYEDVPLEALSVVGNTAEKFVEYTTGMFPCLVMLVWRAAFHLKDDSGWEEFYKSNFFFRLYLQQDEEASLPQ